MRKSIKKIAATMLAATMVFGTFTTAFGYTVSDVEVKDENGNVTGTEKQITDLEEGEASTY